METFVTTALLGGGLLLAVLGVLVVAVGVRRQRREQPWPQVLAEVVSIEQQRRQVRPNRDRETGTTHLVPVARTVHAHPVTGTPVEHEFVVPGQRPLQVGDEVALAYDPDDPDRVEMPGTLGTPLSGGLLGVVLVVIGLLAALVSTKLVG